MDARLLSKSYEALLGVNLASLMRGLRFGPRELVRASRQGKLAAEPFETSDRRHLRKEFNAIPAVNLDELLSAEKPCIRLEVSAYEDGRLPMSDAIGLLSLLLAERPQEVLEIGTYMGHAARAMAENLETAVIHTVDLPPDYNNGRDAMGLPPKDDLHLISRRTVGREFKGQDCEKRIVQHFGDTARIDFRGMGQPTFFFIDGSHTYEYCKNDSEKCLAIAAPGSTFLWHDCDLRHPGVVRLVSEWRRAGRNLVRIKGTVLAHWKNV